MKIAIIILFVSSSFIGLSQNNQKSSNMIFADSSGIPVTDSLMKFYIGGDVLILCRDCKFDFCNNLIHENGDTAFTALSNTGKQLWLTDDSIIITHELLLKIINKDSNLNAINFLEGYKCNELYKKYGEISKYGIWIIKLKDLKIKTDYVLDICKKHFHDEFINVQDILINNLSGNFQNFKLPVNYLNQVKFEKTNNKYNIITGANILQGY